MEALIAITGPTASGKSQWSERVRGWTGREVLVADAFQFYKEIPILANTVGGRKFENFRSIFEPMNAGEYMRMCDREITSPVILEGTGLYLNAVLYGLDPERVKGTPFQKPPRKDYKMLVLFPEREALYQRINERVEEMVKLGAVEEAEKVFQQTTPEQRASVSSLRAIGLRQLFPVFEGKMSLNQAKIFWKQETRRLAKRQRTWLRKFSPPSERRLWLTELESPTAEESARKFLEV